MTGGGDAPGLNGVIEACSSTLLRAGHSVIGVRDGFDGIFEKSYRDIQLQNIVGLHALAGTFLGTTNRSRIAGREAEFMKNFHELHVDGMIVAGGDGTFAALSAVAPDLKLIGVPKTIDNDLPGTDTTFGFDTACTVVAEAIDALRTSADAHSRVMILETMGRTAGWLALGGGLAGMADAILIPERPFTREKLKHFILEKKAQGQRGMVIVVAESAAPQGEKATIAFKVPESVQSERYGGIAEQLARWIEKECAWESRHVVLGHLQRSRSPTTTDRILSLSMGTQAATLAMQGQWNSCVVYRNGALASVPFTDIQGAPRLVTNTHPWIDMVKTLGIFI